VPEKGRLDRLLRCILVPVGHFPPSNLRRPSPHMILPLRIFSYSHARLTVTLLSPFLPWRYLTFHFFFALEFWREGTPENGKVWFFQLLVDFIRRETSLLFFFFYWFAGVFLPPSSFFLSEYPLVGWINWPRETGPFRSFPFFWIH